MKELTTQDSWRQRRKVNRKLRDSPALSDRPESESTKENFRCKGDEAEKRTHVKAKTPLKT